MGKIKVTRCSRHVNQGRMDVRKYVLQLEETDCFKYVWSQVTADGGCERAAVHRINEG